MRIAKFAAAAAALSMVGTPALAASQPSATASVSKPQPVRASTKLKKSSKVGAALIVPAVILIGVGIAGAAGAFGDDDADSR